MKTPALLLRTIACGGAALLLGACVSPYPYGGYAYDDYGYDQPYYGPGTYVAPGGYVGGGVGYGVSRYRSHHYYGDDHHDHHEHRDHDRHRHGSTGHREESGHQQGEDLKLVRYRQGEHGSVPRGYHSREWFEKRGYDLKSNTFQARDGHRHGARSSRKGSKKHDD